MILCALLHKWTAWSVVVIVNGRDAQYRHCKRCRKADMRYVVGDTGFA
jgi:hypothetical protein